MNVDKKIIVLDASMALSWIFERNNKKEQSISQKLLDTLTNYQILVPALFHTEIINSLLVGERRKILTETQSTSYLHRLSKFPIATDNAAPASRREALLSLGRAQALSAYDAAYLDLSLRCDGILATFDQALEKAVIKIGGAVFS